MVCRALEANSNSGCCRAYIACQELAAVHLQKYSVAAVKDGMSDKNVRSLAACQSTAHMSNSLCALNVCGLDLDRRADGSATSAETCSGDSLALHCPMSPSQSTLSVWRSHACLAAGNPLRYQCSFHMNSLQGSISDAPGSSGGVSLGVSHGSSPRTFFLSFGATCRTMMSSCSTQTGRSFGSRRTCFVR